MLDGGGIEKTYQHAVLEYSVSICFNVIESLFAPFVFHLAAFQKRDLLAVLDDRRMVLPKLAFQIFLPAQHFPKLWHNALRGRKSIIVRVLHSVQDDNEEGV